MLHKRNSIKLRILFFSLFITVFSVQYAYSQPAIGIQAGSTGIGLEIIQPIKENLHIRANGSFFTYQKSGVVDDDPDYKYSFDSGIKNVGGVVDYYPLNDWFRVSGGIYYHDFVVEGDIKPIESYEMDGKVFEPEKLGSVNGKVNYKSKIAPYMGVGFGNALRPGSRIKLGVELGALFTNNPRVEMDGEGMVAPTANQADTLEDAMYSFKLYPVFNISIMTKL